MWTSGKKIKNGEAASTQNRRERRDHSKIVIISDIHGNFDALKALPDDYDELWVLGDLVNFGPQPAEVIEFIQEKASLVVRGNHDDAVAFNRDPRCSAVFGRAAQEVQKYTASVLTEDHKGYLADLPHFHWARRGRWTFYLCHAVPSDPLYTYCAAESRAWAREVSLAGSDFLFVGHTHNQFYLQLGEQSILNPGSIGQPKMGSPRANYAIWENGSVVLHSYEYQVARTSARVRSMPVSSEVQEFLIRVLETGTVPKSNTKRIHVKNQGA